VAFDYDHSGKQDHLVVYRPGSKTLSIVKHQADGTFAQVFTTTSGFPDFSLSNTADRLIAFDGDHSGKRDHLVLYRPGANRVTVLKHQTDGSFSAVLNSSSGIAGLSVTEASDRLVAFDYDQSGKEDHLVAYRPGWSLVAVVEHRSDGSFAPVFTSDQGIGGFDLSGGSDDLVPFDFGHDGSARYLLGLHLGSGSAVVVGRRTGAATPASTAPVQPAPGADALVEDYGYPGAAFILASQHLELISGDGHILLADCATPAVNNVSVIRVWTTEPVGSTATGQVCFKVTAAKGRLDLKVPGVYEIRGDGQKSGAGHRVTATITTDAGPPTTVTVNPSGSTQVGIGTGPDSPEATLLQLRVPS